jgi:hypothetical protein
MNSCARFADLLFGYIELDEISGFSWFCVDKKLRLSTKALFSFGDPSVPLRLPFDLPRGPEGLATIGDPCNDENLLVAQTHLALLRLT